MISPSAPRRPLLAAALACTAAPLFANAATIAYWRFEELPAGSDFPAPSTDGGPDSGLAIDSAGGDDALRTWAGFTNPVYSSSVPGPTVGQTGAANNASLDFTPSEDLYAAPGGPLRGHVFGNAFTLEASFNVDNLTRYHGLVGKDGSPIAGNPLSAVQLKVRDDSDRLQIEILDSSGVARSVVSTDPIVTGRWYNAAAVSDGTSLSLYLDDTTDPAGYVLQGSIPTVGGIYDGGPADWTVGRGFYNNGIADWTAGLIDEVRISDTALAPSEFLATVPEPAGLTVLAAGGLLLGRRRRTR